MSDNAQQRKSASAHVWPLCHTDESPRKVQNQSLPNL